MTRCPRAGETGRIMGKRGRILVTTESITPHSPQHATKKSATRDTASTAVRRAPEDGNAAASSQTAVAFSAEEAKRERKRLKKKRQKERQSLRTPHSAAVPIVSTGKSLRRSGAPAQRARAPEGRTYAFSKFVEFHKTNK